MKKTLLLAAILIGLGAAQAALAEHIAVFTADLKAGNELPPNTSNGTGVVFLILEDDYSLRYTVRSTGFGAAPNAVTAGHIHAGPANASGPVRFPFTMDALGNGSGTIQLQPSEAVELLKGDFYVNLHTQAFPSGAVRGQLQQNAAPALLFRAALSGASEIPPTSSTGTAEAFIFFNPSTNKLGYLVTVTHAGSEPVTAAHIHAGGAKEDGPMVVPFTIDSSGNGADIVIVSDSTKSKLLTSALYVNVHTASYPKGAYRGQAEYEPGPAFKYVFRRNLKSGTRMFTPAEGPSVLDTETERRGDKIDLMEATLAAGIPDVMSMPSFDRAEFPSAPIKTVYNCRRVNLSTDSIFHVEPGLAVPASYNPAGISQPDLRNLYFLDFTVSINDQNINQVSAIPNLVGPVVIGYPQLGLPADAPPLAVTFYNVCYSIDTPGDYTVVVSYKQYKNLQIGPAPKDNWPAGEFVYVIPVTVTGSRRLPYFLSNEQSTVNVSQNMFETRMKFQQLLSQSLSERIETTDSGDFAGMQAEMALGPSLEFSYSVNPVSGKRSFSPKNGPPIYPSPTSPTSAPINLIALATAAPPQSLIAGPAFDAGEYPSGPLRVRILTQRISIPVNTSIYLNPGLLASATKLPGGISQPDFRNLYFQDYTVSIDDLDVNQVAAIPTLFGPMSVNTAAGPALATSYNIAFNLQNPGDFLVSVKWKTYKSLQNALVDGSDLPAAEINISIPITVTGKRSRGPVFETAISGNDAGQTHATFGDLICKAIDGYIAGKRSVIP